MQIYHHLIPRSVSQRIVSVLVILILLLSHVPAGRANSVEDDRKKHDQVIAMYDEYKKSFADIQDISSKDALPLIKNSDVVFVDVRKPEEQQVSMIPGAVTKEYFLENLETYRNKRIIAYCTISYRSGKFAEKMEKKGVTVINLQAGLLGWVHVHGPLVSKNKPANTLHVYGRKWNLAPSWIITVY